MALLLEDLIRRGAVPQHIRVVTVVCAPAALQRLSPAFPGAAASLPCARLHASWHACHAPVGSH